jgi:hypothetical protein
MQRTARLEFKNSDEFKGKEDLAGATASAFMSMSGPQACRPMKTSKLLAWGQRIMKERPASED